MLRTDSEQIAVRNTPKHSEFPPYRRGLIVRVTIVLSLTVAIFPISDSGHSIFLIPPFPEWNIAMVVVFTLAGQHLLFIDLCHHFLYGDSS
uniref:7TM_GPCR_Srx domain-containing protein n=1 Tax=Steinernema glaseri TaxID=37863 RepID=A0A1I7Y0P3_9BILA